MKSFLLRFLIFRKVLQFSHSKDLAEKPRKLILLPLTECGWELWLTAVRFVIVLLISGLFDRLFIDWYWVGRTKAWVIPGTEELMPYIYGKTLVKKWVGTLVGFPALAAIIAGVMGLFR